MVIEATDSSEFAEDSAPVTESSKPEPSRTSLHDAMKFEVEQIQQHTESFMKDKCSSNLQKLKHVRSVLMRLSLRESLASKNRYAFASHRRSKRFRMRVQNRRFKKQ